MAEYRSKGFTPETSKSQNPVIIGCTCVSFEHKNLNAAKDALRELADEFSDQCEAKDVARSLYSGKVLSESDITAIDGLPDRRDRGMKLVRLLQSCTNEVWFDRFLGKISCEPAHHRMVEKLHSRKCELFIFNSYINIL